MTSMEFFPPKHHTPSVPPEWGTGKHKEHVNLWTAKTPTWHYSGKPVEQFYTLTQLKLSNVRSNDQLLPRPQDVEMGKIMINKGFPAEHPYSSHMSRHAVFPKFDSPEDPKRGVQARKQMPKSSEMPSNAFDVTIVHKTKGYGDRHEIQKLPSESLKKPLEWHSGTFDQLIKSPSGGQQAYYPTPPKVFVPNLEQRDNSRILRGSMIVTPRTANATRNVERDQWQTTYDINHTGIGPSNPKKLDNLAEKHSKKILTGLDDDNLYPRSVPIFTPPRPKEGRLERLVISRPPPQTDRFGNPPDDPDYQQKMTLKEWEEYRLWNGKEYVSLPDRGGKHEWEQWNTMNEAAHPDTRLGELSLDVGSGEPTPVPFAPSGPPPPPEEGYLSKTKEEQHQVHQQIEAANRWKELELQKPHHDLTALKHKMDMVSDKTQPNVFYKHEGDYQRERSGLYKTSYDPYSLQYSMNKKEVSGPEMMYTMDSHKDALNLPVDLNQDMADAMRYGRTLGGPPGSVPQLNRQASQYEAFGPFEHTKSHQKAVLHPQATPADVRTQEKGIVLRESTYGGDYNTKKFLQENELQYQQRNEPLVLMSHENQNLNQVRSATLPRTSKSLQFADEVTVAYGAGAEPIRLASADIANPKSERPFSELDRPDIASAGVQTTRVGIEGPSGTLAASLQFDTIPTLQTGPSKEPQRYTTLPVDISKDRITSVQNQMKKNVDDLFASKSTNVLPSGLQNSMQFRSAYQSQFPTENYVDMNFKEDPFQFWSPHSDVPRPHISIVKVQDRFTKSGVRKKFRSEFPESAPDLRENISSGKKHEFSYGLNAQVLRGTPIIDVA